MTRLEPERWRMLVQVACGVFAFGCYDASSSRDVGKNANPLDAAFGNEGFSQIWGSSDDDIWALGQDVPPDQNAATSVGVAHCNANMPVSKQTYVVRHFDGRAWVRSEVKAEFLSALHGSDRDNVWMVGSHTVLRLQGKKWVAQDIADAIEHDTSVECFEDATLMSVFARAADDVWAVGSIAPSTLGAGLIIHFDGTRWSRMPVDAGDGFLAVWAAAEDDAWAMGSSGHAYHYDGDHWSSVEIGTQQYVWSIWGSARDDVWASGNSGTQLHYDGARWTSVASSVQGELRSLTGRAPDDVWNVPQPTQNPDQDLLHWDGVSWQITPVPSSDMIQDLWLSPTGKLWSAGERLTRRN